MCIRDRPEPYAEMVQTAIGRKNRAASDFLDLFNHRLVALLYRAHKAQNPPLTGQSPDRGQIAQYLFSLIGLGPVSYTHLGGRARAVCGGGEPQVIRLGFVHGTQHAARSGEVV